MAGQIDQLNVLNSLLHLIASSTVEVKRTSAEVKLVTYLVKDASAEVKRVTV